MVLDDKKAARAFQDGAARIGLELDGNFATGEIDGFPIFLYVYESHGKYGPRGHFKVELAFTPPLDCGLHIGLFRRGFRGDEGDRVQTLTGQAGLAFLAHRSRDVEVDDSSFRFERNCAGAVQATDVEETLAWALRFAELAAAIREARRDTRPPSPVAPFEAGLVRFAAQLGLSTSRSPLAAFGAIAEGDLRVAALRVKKGLFSMQARLKLEFPSLLGFSILPNQKAIDGPGRVVLIKHEAFARSFEVRATKSEAANAFLDDSMCDWFCEEYERYANMSFEGGVFQLSNLPLDPEQPDMMAEMGEHVLEVARRFSRTDDRSPYRA